MIDDRRKWTLKFILYFAPIYAFIIIYTTVNANKKLRANMGVTCGYIRNIELGAGSTRFVYYTYYFRNKEIRRNEINSSLGTLRNIERHKNKHFIVVFDSTDLKDSRMIIQSRDLERYNLTKDDWNKCVDSVFRE